MSVKAPSLAKKASKARKTTGGTHIAAPQLAPAAPVEIELEAEVSSDISEGGEVEESEWETVSKEDE